MTVLSIYLKDKEKFSSSCKLLFRKYNCASVSELLRKLVREQVKNLEPNEVNRGAYDVDSKFEIRAALADILERDKKNKEKDLETAMDEHLSEI